MLGLRVLGGRPARVLRDPGAPGAELDGFFPPEHGHGAAATTHGAACLHRLQRPRPENCHGDDAVRAVRGPDAWHRHGPHEGHLRARLVIGRTGGHSFRRGVGSVDVRKRSPVRLGDGAVLLLLSRDHVDSGLGPHGGVELGRHGHLQGRGEPTCLGCEDRAARGDQLRRHGHLRRHRRALYLRQHIWTASDRPEWLAHAIAPCLCVGLIHRGAGAWRVFWHYRRLSDVARLVAVRLAMGARGQCSCFRAEGESFCCGQLRGRFLLRDPLPRIR
mmetsp:Transcript_133231/g.385557  ORF Transcript_133231/g.385557 Transcript_133231/m.385557 type:complete len:274 (-) Transcript_133231:445-1266(-)